MANAVADEIFPGFAAEPLFGLLRLHIAPPVMEVNAVAPAATHDQVRVLGPLGYVPVCLAATRAAIRREVEANGVTTLAGKSAIDVVREHGSRRSLAALYYGYSATRVRCATETLKAPRRFSAD